MLEEVITHSMKTMPRDDAIRLLDQLQDAEWLPAAYSPPSGWLLLSEVPSEDLATTIREHLSKTGWRRLIAAMRCHNRQSPDTPWHLAREDHFLAAIELALRQQDVVRPDEKQKKGLNEQPDISPGKGILGIVQSWQRHTRTPEKTAEVDGWFLFPQALWTQIRARAKQARAQAEIESTLSDTALYAARMEGAEVECAETLNRVDKLRSQLHHQLQVFCEEQGITTPTPYSREEAYILHLLAAHFVSLAEAEEIIARRGAALARRQIALEGERSEADINSKRLPELLEILEKTDPLREGFWRERIRHRTALIVGSVIAAVLGSLWGVVESVSDILIAGIARYAPVVAPTLFVSLLTLVIQTAVNGLPLTWSRLLEYLLGALWNGVLALAASLIVYGCWQYFNQRSSKPNTRHNAKIPGEKSDDIETTDNMA